MSRIADIAAKGTVYTPFPYPPASDLDPNLKN